MGWRYRLGLMFLLASGSAFGGGWGSVLKSVASEIQRQAGAAAAPSGPAAEPEGEGAAGPTEPVAKATAATGEVWADPATGLTWRRCPLGDRFSGGKCLDKDERDEDTRFRGLWWEAAAAVQQLNAGGFSDWRLPTLTELNDVRHACRSATEPDKAPVRSPEPFQPEFQDVPVKAGTVRVQTNCLGPDNRRALDEHVFVFINPNLLNADDRFWTSTQATDTQQPAVLSPIRIRMWASDHGRFDYAPNNGDRYEVLPVRGGSYDEFHAMLARVKDAQAQLTAARAASDREQAKADAYRRQEAQDRLRAQQDYKRRTTALRRSVGAGDEVAVLVDTATRRGLVMEVKGAMARVQITELGQSLWFRREQLFPVR